MLTISNEKRTLCKDGKPFFYLADTCWSAFTNIEIDEWKYYLAYRKAQGFNAIQINILPQWDASGALEQRTPFKTGNPKDLKVADLDLDYFERARKMCLMAKEEGFELALVALWCNFIPGTWGSAMGRTLQLPLSFLEGYAQLIKHYFGDLTSLFMVSGDTDFSEASIPYYLEMAQLLREHCPQILQTMHIKGRLTELPEDIEDAIDIYFYQSGHNSEDRSNPYTMAQQFYQKKQTKPIINSEPCYEQMGYSRRVYGRWSQLDIRKAAWQSVLSGACAGITYGAHGIYSWHRLENQFNEEIGEAFDQPNPWQYALHYPGAWDYGFLKYLIDTQVHGELVPANDLLVKEKPGICVSEYSQGYLIYVPSPSKLELNILPKFSEGYVYDLSANRVSPLHIKDIGDTTVIKQQMFTEDILIFLKKESK